MGRLAIGIVMACLMVGPLAAQERTQTLADIRQELTVLYVEIQRLKRELSTTGPVQTQVAGSVLDRVQAIETALAQITSKAESLEFRIERLVEDGTNRVGDLEFRLCELEEACDIAALGETPSLGGEDLIDTVAPITPADPEGPELATGEQSAFDAARTALEAGEHASAADQFLAFTTTYPGGPLSGEAHFFRGEALAALGDTPNAARAYLESFSGSPTGPRAGDALLRLGQSLGSLGQTREACVTLSEVSVRFPGTAAANEATQAVQTLNCR